MKRFFSIHHPVVVPVMWAKIRKLVSLKKLTSFLVLAATIISIYGLWSLHNDGAPLRREAFGVENEADGQQLCHNAPKQGEAKALAESKAFVNSRTRQHALLFLQDGSTHRGKQILYMFQAARLKYHSQYGAIRNLPALIDNDKGRYAAIVFEDANIYLQMNQWNREILDKYCTEYDVGIILFVLSETQKSAKAPDNEKLGDFPLQYTTNVDLKDCTLNPNSKILRITRAGETVKGKIGNKWSVFKGNHSTYEVVTSASLLNPNTAKERKFFARNELRKQKSSRLKRGISRIFNLNVLTRWSDGLKFDTEEATSNKKYNKFPTVLLDTGQYDGIKRVLFGNDLSFWLNKILFMDALSFLSNGKLSLPLERYIQIDIDDIFVSAIGTRMKEDDVMELIKFQRNMRKKVPGFNLLLGFSGKFFQKGTPEEQAGDAAFLRESHNFLWFPHMWSHMQAHLFSNTSVLCDYMLPNKEFAKRHKFNVSTRYAVAPHHSGIFPVHEPLYDCWRKVWDIETTSTEEYPNLRPDTKRRGFVHKEIKVLPRQTCGLYTHTNYLNKYPGGPQKLLSLIKGGQLFQTFLLNQFNIYMTHFSNYGNDRLAHFVFDNVVDFVQCWTNLRLLQVPPHQLAEKYFNEYPDEVEPVWTNPCADPRHLEIWSKDKNCDRLPKFVIVGPQKTGTTALHWFLQMHPKLKTSKLSPETFEEIQFFNSHNYFKGLDWYMDFFPMPSVEDETIFFEKSANYFDKSIVPRRLSALLPKSYVIVLIVDPAKRAYSWYQHMRSHNDPTAMKYSFYEVIRAKKKASAALLRLQSRCLSPGRYAENIDKWMEYFSSQQVVIEDGELLIKNPLQVLERLQRKLELPTVFNYSSIIRFDETKGFFCQIKENQGTKCLGKGKGRKYPEMSEKSRIFLEEYFRDSNKRLLQILKDFRRPVPIWLRAYNSTVT